jgi:hypothetical protein
MRFQPVAQRTTSLRLNLPVRRRFASHASALGHIVRSNSSHGNGGPPGEAPEDGVVNDHEWELRAGLLGPSLPPHPINVTAYRASGRHAEENAATVFRLWTCGQTRQ